MPYFFLSFNCKTIISPYNSVNCIWKLCNWKLKELILYFFSSIPKWYHSSVLFLRRLFNEFHLQPGLLVSFLYCGINLGRTIFIVFIYVFSVFLLRQAYKYLVVRWYCKKENKQITSSIVVTNNR